MPPDSNTIASAKHGAVQAANHGFWRTMPFVCGASIGFTLLLIFVGFWFFKIIGSHPLLLQLLNVAGSIFILYVGYKIASAPSELSSKKKHSPGFIQGFLLQWLNPKAWIACASGAALFSSPQTHTRLMLFTAIYFVICYLSQTTWAALGERVSILLNSPWRIRVFNLTMASLLLITACYMLYLQFF